MHFHLQDIIQTLKDCKAMTQNITATGKGQSKNSSLRVWKIT